LLSWRISISNVVGYTEKELRAGATMLTPCFIDVGGVQEIDLTALTIKGYDEVSADEVNIQILNAFGKTTTTYYWFDLPDEGLDAGWYNADTELIDSGTVKFTTGDGLWISGQNGYSIVFPGQVKLSASVVALRTGATATGNMFATNLDLADLTVTGYDEVSADEVNIQILNAFGKTTTTYYWNDLPDEGLEAGWYNADTELIEEGTVIFAPGTGMWVSGQNGYFLNFPALAL
jgi:hypothetical protein